MTKNHIFDDNCKRIGRELNPIRWDLQSHASPLCHLSVLDGIFNAFINFGLV